MTITVTGIRVAHHHLPREVWWNVPIEDLTLAIDAIDVVIVELSTAEGITGMGYTYTLSHGGGAAAALVAQEIAPQLVGMRVDHPAPFWNQAWSRMQRYGRGGLASVALAAVDVALWDALAKQAGLPLHRFLGSFRDAVPIYGSSIDLGYDLDRLLDTAQEWKDRGVGAVKIKVGRQLADDLERLAAVRNLLGDRIDLMVDANNGWTLPEAGARIAAMEPFGLTWVEEPLHPDDVEGHASLQRQSGIAIAGGESLFSIAEFRRYFEADALRYVQADIGRLDGITPWMAAATLAAAHHLPMAPHFMHDLHVHTLCAVPNAYRLEYLPLLDAVMEHPLAIVDGHAAAPDRPGHGVAFTAAIDPHVVTEWRL